MKIPEGAFVQQDVIIDSGFYLVRDDKYYVHIATWKTYEQAVEEVKGLPRTKIDPYIVIRNEDGTGAIYRPLEESY